MFRIEIDGYCDRSNAPRFDSFDDAQRFYDVAYEFVYRMHSKVGVEIYLFDDDVDYPVLWSVVEHAVEKE